MAFILYVLGVPAAAVLLVVRCRRHAPLLWLGGLAAVPSGWVMLTLLFPGPARDTHNDALYALADLPLLVAGAVLLVVGVVRWRRAGSDHRGPRRACKA